MLRGQGRGPIQITRSGDYSPRVEVGYIYPEAKLMPVLGQPLVVYGNP
jgi:hypothetical protein